METFYRDRADSQARRDGARAVPQHQPTGAIAAQGALAQPSGQRYSDDPAAASQFAGPNNNLQAEQRLVQMPPLTWEPTLQQLGMLPQDMRQLAMADHPNDGRVRDRESQLIPSTQQVMLLSQQPTTVLGTKPVAFQQLIPSTQQVMLLSQQPTTVLGNKPAASHLEQPPTIGQFQLQVAPPDQPLRTLQQQQPAAQAHLQLIPSTQQVMQFQQLPTTTQGNQPTASHYVVATSAAAPLQPPPDIFQSAAGAQASQAMQTTEQWPTFLAGTSQQQSIAERARFAELMSQALAAQMIQHRTIPQQTANISLPSQIAQPQQNVSLPQFEQQQ